MFFLCTRKSIILHWILVIKPKTYELEGTTKRQSGSLKTRTYAIHPNPRLGTKSGQRALSGLVLIIIFLFDTLVID